MCACDEFNDLIVGQILLIKYSQSSHSEKMYNKYNNYPTELLSIKYQTCETLYILVLKLGEGGGGGGLLYCVKSYILKACR